MTIENNFESFIASLCELNLAKAAQTLRSITKSTHKANQCYFKDNYSIV